MYDEALHLEKSFKYVEARVKLVEVIKKYPSAYIAFKAKDRLRSLDRIIELQRSAQIIQSKTRVLGTRTIEASGEIEVARATPGTFRVVFGTLNSRGYLMFPVSKSFNVDGTDVEGKRTFRLQVQLPSAYETKRISAQKFLLSTPSARGGTTWIPLRTVLLVYPEDLSLYH